MTTVTNPVAERVGAAFRHLVRTGTPATAAQLAVDLEYTEPIAQRAIDGLGPARLAAPRRSGPGHRLGRLSMHPDRHQIDFDGRRYWTWYAYDILGIFAACTHRLGTIHQSRHRPVRGDPFPQRPARTRAARIASAAGHPGSARDCNECTRLAGSARRRTRSNSPPSCAQRYREVCC